MIIGDIMNRLEGQNQIFSLIKDYYLKNGKIDSSDIYKIITEFGFTDEEKVMRVKKSLFNFKGIIKTRGLIADNEDISFIPFSYSSLSNDELETALKLYISVDSKSLSLSYSKIRNFVSKQEIKSNNKARNRVTNDDIVLRIPKMDDVEKVRSFIKNDTSLRNNIKHSNPFLVQDELGICYSMDGVSTSVNNELSILLNSFMKECNGNLNMFNRDNFKQYLKNKRTKFYIDYPQMSLYYPESNRINNLILLSMDDDFDYKKMKEYTLMIQSLKDSLKRVNISSLISIVYNNLIKKYSRVDTINKICNIDSIQENDFDTPFLYILSKMYLTTDLVVNYLSTMSYEDMERNNKKSV